jgi:hypothetical protein
MCTHHFLETSCGPLLSRESQDKGVTVDVTSCVLHAGTEDLALCQVTHIRREKTTILSKRICSKGRVVWYCCTKVKLFCGCFYDCHLEHKRFRNGYNKFILW